MSRHQYPDNACVADDRVVQSSRDNVSLIQSRYGQSGSSIASLRLLHRCGQNHD